MTRVYFAIVLAFFVSFLNGCSRSPEKEAGISASGVVAVVNGDKITSHDVERELALRSKRDPSFKITPHTLKEQVDVMVNRKILIQEAMDRKLAEDEQFVGSIQNFWEQTLIRSLLERMSKDFEKSAFATEEEIQRYYDNLGALATFEIARRADEKSATELAGLLVGGSAVEWDERIGPIGFDQVSSPVLERAFELEPGQARVFQERGIFHLVRMAAKEPASRPELADVRERIKTQITQRKQRQLFETWLAEKRRGSDIKLFAQNAAEKK